MNLWVLGYCFKTDLKNCDHLPFKIKHKKEVYIHPEYISCQKRKQTKRFKIHLLTAITIKL